MKHAALIIAHKNVEQLIRMIKSISSEDIHVFVHLDKKMSISGNDIHKIISCSDNVYIINERISGVLDTWSLVEISMGLIRYAKKTELELNIKYSYYILLSGQDYPIKNKNYILEYLNNHYPKPIIDCTPCDKTNWVYHKFYTVAFYGASSYINSITRPGVVRKIIKIPFYVTGKVLTTIKKLAYRKFLSYGYALYGGSAWWILPDRVIDFILGEMNSNINEIKKLKRTCTPEETFFQVMTMASPLADMVDVNPKDMREQNCMTYAYFSDVGKPFVGHPYVFDKEDFNKIKNYPHLFARKFDAQVDSDIFDLIDGYIEK